MQLLPLFLFYWMPVSSAASLVALLKERIQVSLAKLFIFCYVLFVGELWLSSCVSSPLSSVLDNVRSVVRSAFTRSRGVVSGRVAITRCN